MSRTPRPPPGTRPPAAAATAAAAAAACVGAGRRQGVRGGRLVVASRPAAPVGRRNGRADVRACESVQMSAIRRCSGVSCVPVGCQRTSTRPAANERTTAARRETREARTYTLTAARAHARRPRPCPRRPTPCARIHDTSTTHPHPHSHPHPQPPPLSTQARKQKHKHSHARTHANSLLLSPLCAPGFGEPGTTGPPGAAQSGLACSACSAPALRADERTDELAGVRHLQHPAGARQRGRKRASVHECVRACVRACVHLLAAGGAASVGGSRVLPTCPADRGPARVRNGQAEMRSQHSGLWAATPRRL